MKIFRNKEALAQFVSAMKAEKKSIGFVPTMGALHAGHLFLVKTAAQENDVVVVSIFVNPTQFNNREDFEKYPNTVEQDILALENDGFATALYLPQVEDLYPAGLAAAHYDLGKLEKMMEGEFRPGHFQGVATVVDRLFRQVKPTQAYFGEKDFQQIAVIRRMAEITKSKVEIIAVPTQRAENGLALSSRNLRLSEAGRQKAVLLFETLEKVKMWFRILSIPEIYERVQTIFAENPDFTLEYFEITDEKTLEKADFFYAGREYRAFIVAYLEGVRLIDNVRL